MTSQPSSDDLTDLLARIERYYDAAPRPNARTLDVGPFTLFVNERPGGWPHYARPRLGLAAEPTAVDVDAVRARQRELGVPEALEWVHQTTPALLGAARATGLQVHEHPLLVLGDDVPPASVPAGVAVRVLAADDPALPATQAAIHLGFGEPGTDVGSAGPAERDAAAGGSHDMVRAGITAGTQVVVAALDESGPVAGGSHNPRRTADGLATELAGIATLPSARRRGLGAAVTAALVADARARGVDLVLLSASDDDVARIYEKVGFRRVGTACVAELPDTPS
ncbi:MAG TPA: GNAT family N-acetyltransferase [Motilibacteraceae bacterium]|nr:GNAT family N-acetyltransferase [Motilibacteraceae bacterium]